MAIRLFIAIELPDGLKRAFAGLRTPIPGARWVPPEQIHLTLAFLGEVEETAVGHLHDELSRIRIPSFKLRPAGTGCFPGRQRARVLWVGLEPEPHLRDLAAAVQSVLLACGIPQEERPFSPHITLARLKLPAPREVGLFLSGEPKHAFPLVPVREFILFQSRLSSAGAQHVPLHSFPLT